MADVTVTAGVLPIKLKMGADERELDRAKFLIASLGRNWRGEAPFALHVVGMNTEIEEIEAGVRPINDRYRNLNVACHSEDKFFADVDAFYQSSGIYKQQFIKMFVPPRLRMGAFMTFDADIVCLAPFDERTFVRDGRLISTWEPRDIHSWWENSMSALRAWTPLNAPGLGVTPNVLHADICSLIETYFAHRGLDAIAELSRIAVQHPHLRKYEVESGIALSWSEYSLYNIVGEWFGEMERYHLSASEVKATGVHLHSIGSVWGKEPPERLTIYKDEPGHFVIVQSWSGVSIEEVARRLEIPLD